MLPKQLFEGQSLTPEEIEDNLAAESHSHVPGTYYRPLTPDEITDRKNEMPLLDMNYEDLAEAKKASSDEYTGKMKPIKARKNELLTEVRAGQRKEKGEMYKMLFPEEKRAGFYDRAGRLISERTMTPEERNTLFHNGTGSMKVNRTGTDGTF